jgi:hypothetical protein
MDWIENHDAILDCKSKKLYFVDDTRHKIILVKMNMGVSIRFISVLQLKKSVRKECKLYDVSNRKNK